MRPIQYNSNILSLDPTTTVTAKHDMSQKQVNSSGTLPVSTSLARPPPPSFSTLYLSQTSSAQDSSSRFKFNQQLPILPESVSTPSFSTPLQSNIKVQDTQTPSNNLGHSILDEPGNTNRFSQLSSASSVVVVDGTGFETVSSTGQQAVLGASKLYSHENVNLDSKKVAAGTISVSTPVPLSKKRYSIFRRSDVTIGWPYNEAPSPVPQENIKTSESLATSPHEVSSNNGPFSGLRQKLNTRKRNSTGEKRNSSGTLHNEKRLSEENKSSLAPPVINVHLPRDSIRSSSVYSEVPNNKQDGSNSTAKPSSLSSRRESIVSTITQLGRSANPAGSRPNSFYAKFQSIPTSTRQSVHNTEEKQTKAPTLPLQSYPRNKSPYGSEVPRISFHLNRSSGLFSPNDLFGPGGILMNRSSHSMTSSTLSGSALPSLSGMDVSTPPVPPLPSGYQPSDVSSTKTSSTFSIPGLAFVEEYGPLIERYNTAAPPSGTISLASLLGHGGNSTRQITATVTSLPQVQTIVHPKYSSQNSLVTPILKTNNLLPASLPVSPRSPSTEQNPLPPLPTTSLGIVTEKFDEPISKLSPVPVSPAITSPSVSVSPAVTMPLGSMSPPMSLHRSKPGINSVIGQSPEAYASSGVFSIVSDYHSAISHEKEYSSPSPPPLPEFPSNIVSMQQHNIQPKQSEASMSSSERSENSQWTPKKIQNKKNLTTTSRRNRLQRRRTGSQDISSINTGIPSSRNLSSVKYEKVMSTVPPVASAHASIVAASSPGSSFDEKDPVPAMPLINLDLTTTRLDIGPGFSKFTEEEVNTPSTLLATKPNSDQNSLQVSERRGSLAHRYSVSSSIFQNKTPSIRSSRTSIGSSNPYLRTTTSPSTSAVAVITPSLQRKSFADHRLSVSSGESSRRPPMLLSVNKKLPKVPNAEDEERLPTHSQSGSKSLHLDSLFTTPRMAVSEFSTPSHTPPTPPPPPKDGLSSGGSSITYAVSTSNRVTPAYGHYTGRPKSGHSKSSTSEASRHRKKRSKHLSSSSSSSAKKRVHDISAGPPSAPIRKLTALGENTGYGQGEKVGRSQSTPLLSSPSVLFSIEPAPVPPLSIHSKTSSVSSQRHHHHHNHHPGSSIASSRKSNKSGSTDGNKKLSTIITSSTGVSPLSALENQHQRTLLLLQKEQQQLQRHPSSTPTSQFNFPKKVSPLTGTTLGPPIPVKPSVPPLPLPQSPVIERQLQQTIHVHQVTHDYTPLLYEDELLLRKGDQLVVMEIFDDGWCLACLVTLAGKPGDAVNINRMIEGVCPMVCLTKEPVLSYKKPVNV